MRILLAFLALLTILAPGIAAQEACAGPACAYIAPSDRMSFIGAFAYEENTDTFVGGGWYEGSGFFGDVMGVDMFVHNGLVGQYAVVVLAFNDAGRDGDYEYGALVVSAWSDIGVPSVVAVAGFSDTDRDGTPDADGVFAGAGSSLLP